MALTTHLHLASRLRLREAIPLFPLHAFMAWTGTTWLVLCCFHKIPCRCIWCSFPSPQSLCNSVSSKQQTYETHQTWMCGWYISLNIKHFVISWYVSDTTPLKMWTCTYCTLWFNIAGYLAKQLVVPYFYEVSQMLQQFRISIYTSAIRLMRWLMPTSLMIALYT